MSITHMTSARERLRALAESPPKPAKVTIVLVPEDLGGLRAYLRKASSPLVSGPVFTTLDDLDKFLFYIRPAPRLILCGSRYADGVSRITKYKADLFIVPAQWLRNMPPHEPLLRAAYAVQLVTAHRSSPIDCRLAWNSRDDDDIPF